MKKNGLKIASMFIVPLCAVTVASLMSLSSYKNDMSKAEAAGYAPGYTPSKTYTFGDGATYYNSISSALEGDNLLSALRTLNSNRHKTTLYYSTGGTSSSSSYYVYTDYYTATGKDKNGAPYGNAISSFYTYTKSTSFNKEHVWPDSRGGGKVEHDAHMPRPTITSENSSRGNSFYVENKCTEHNGWDPVTAGYNEFSRGEAARIMLYCVVASSDLRLLDVNYLDYKDSGYSYCCGKLSTILKWNLNYPVTQREINRNEGVEYLQGNRNPFIDHPEYGCKIFGNYNDTCRKLCGLLPDPDPDPDSESGSSSSEGPTTSDPSINSNEPPIDNPTRKGCNGVVTTTSGIVFLSSAIGLLAAIKIKTKKKKDDSNK